MQCDARRLLGNAEPRPSARAPAIAREAAY